MLMLRWISVFVVVVAPMTASGQDFEDQERSDGAFDIDETWLQKPMLNAAACEAGAPGAPISVRLQHLNAPVPLDDAELLVWWEVSNDTECDGATPSDNYYLGDALLDIDDTFLNGTGTKTIPDDIEDSQGAEPELTSYSILTLEQACTTDVDQTVTLCFGLDEDRDNIIEPGDQSTDFEPHGWVRMLMDTDVPPQPTITTVAPFSGELDVRVKVDGADDIERWEARMRPRAEIEADPASDCSTWTITGSSTTSTITLKGTNGVEYGICVWVIDDLDNKSPYSELSYGTPKKACAAMQCLDNGYIEGGCTSTPKMPFWLAVLSLPLVRRWRRNDTQRPSLEADS